MKTESLSRICLKKVFGAKKGLTKLTTKNDLQLSTFTNMPGLVNYIFIQDPKKLWER